MRDKRHRHSPTIKISWESRRSCQYHTPQSYPENITMSLKAVQDRTVSTLQRRVSWGGMGVEGDPTPNEVIHSEVSGLRLDPCNSTFPVGKNSFILVRTFQCSCEKQVDHRTFWYIAENCPVSPRSFPCRVKTEAPVLSTGLSLMALCYIQNFRHE